jgi:hypothetical protein
MPCYKVQVFASTEYSVWLPGKESLDSSLGQPWLMDPYSWLGILQDVFTVLKQVRSALYDLIYQPQLLRTVTVGYKWVLLQVQYAQRVGAPSQLILRLLVFCSRAQGQLESREDFRLFDCAARMLSWLEAGAHQPGSPA